MIMGTMSLRFMINAIPAPNVPPLHCLGPRHSLTTYNPGPCRGRPPCRRRPGAAGDRPQSQAGRAPWRLAPAMIPSASLRNGLAAKANLVRI